MSKSVTERFGVEDRDAAANLDQLLSDITEEQISEDDALFLISWNLYSRDALDEVKADMFETFWKEHTLSGKFDAVLSGKRKKVPEVDAPKMFAHTVSVYERIKTHDTLFSVLGHHTVFKILALQDLDFAEQFKIDHAEEDDSNMTFSGDDSGEPDRRAAQVHGVGNLNYREPG